MPQSCILQSKGASILPPPLLALQREVSRGVKGTGGNKRGSGQKAELVLQFSCVKRLLTTGWAPFRGRRFPKAIGGAGSGSRAAGRLQQKPVPDRSSSGPRERPSSGVLSSSHSAAASFPSSASFIFLAAISWFSGSLGFHSPIFLPQFLIYSQHWHVTRHRQFLL